MYKQLAKDTLTYGLGDLIIKLISFLLFPIFTSLLSVSDFGVLELGLTLAGLIGIFANFGMSNSIQRFYHEEGNSELDKKDYVSTGMFVILLVSTILLFVSFLSIFLLSDSFIGEFGLTKIVLILIVLSFLPYQIIKYSLDVLRLHFKAKSFIIVTGLQNLLTLIVGILFLKYFGSDILYFFYGYVLSLLLVAPISIIYIKKDLHFSFNKEKYKILVDYGYPLLYMGFAFWLFGSIDRWMLSYLSTTTEVGYYSVGFKIGMVVNFVTMSFGQAFSPLVIKWKNEYKDTFLTNISKVFTSYLSVLIILGVALSLFSKEIISMITPESYWESSKTVSYIVFGLVFNGTMQLTGVGISLAKETKYFNYYAWLTAFVNIVLNYFLIIELQSVGAAIATMISYGLLSVLLMRKSNKYYKFPWEYKKIAYLLLLSAISIFLSHNFNLIDSLSFPIILKISIIVISFISIFLFNIIDYKIVKKIIFQGF